MSTFETCDLCHKERISKDITTFFTPKRFRINHERDLLLTRGAKLCRYCYEKILEGNYVEVIEDYWEGLDNG